MTSKVGKPAIGAGLAIALGLMLWGTRLGQCWEDASFDLLFLTSPRPVTNQVMLILLDDRVRRQLGQSRTNFSRRQYARLVDKLTAGGSALVVFDIFFRPENNDVSDAALAEAIRRHGRAVLMARVYREVLPGAKGHQAALPHPLLLAAAAGWGIGRVGAETNEIPRRHWPMPGSGEEELQGLPWVAARLAGTPLQAPPQEQWLRYYGPRGGWVALPMDAALDPQFPAGSFRNKIVFIGGSPESPHPEIREDDKFCTPYTWRNGEAVGGVEIMATTFLNLVNQDWLQRAPAWLEAILLVLSGAMVGITLTVPGRAPATALAAGISFGVMAVALELSSATNYWFPWLIIAAGQVPGALFWAWLGPAKRPTQSTGGSTVAEVLVTHGYDRLLRLGTGAFGEVWLARSVIGEKKALKVVYRSECEKVGVPYEAEYAAITQYKPISMDPRLLHLDHVFRDDAAGYFFYVMELADPLRADWDGRVETYLPKDLANVAREAGGRLPVAECVAIGLALAEALEFLHDQRLAHRDIKPRNIVWVRGRPKLADIGLVTAMRSASQILTYAGTPGYMPPPPEHPGTPQADIYSLGKVLYVISTGASVNDFPKLPAAVTDTIVRTDFMCLDEIIVKACRPIPGDRYASAAQMHAALAEVQARFAARARHTHGDSP